MSHGGFVMASFSRLGLILLRRFMKVTAAAKKIVLKRWRIRMIRAK
jgi:hypothetical protein